MPESVPPEDSSQDGLRDALRDHGERLPDEIRRLGQALWGDPASPAAHAACLEALPAYIQAEMAGEDVTARMPDVKHHLDLCDSCSTEYADLLDVALAEREGRLGAVPPNAKPDLSFLTRAGSPATGNLQARVAEWTRRILGVLAPEELAQLQGIADAFFARLNASLDPRAQARVLREETAAYGTALAAPRLLAATYATAEELSRDVSVAQFDDWRAQDRLLIELEARSHRAARDLGMDDTEAARFAQTFADQIARDPSALETILPRPG